MTLPKSFLNIIDNLKTKTDLTYLDVRTRLLELVSSSVEPTTKSKALFNKKSDNKDKNKVQKPNRTRPGKAAPVTGNNCTWCNAKGKPFQGHTYKTCHALKEYNATKLGTQNPPPSSSKEVVPYRAATAQELLFHALSSTGSEGAVEVPSNKSSRS
ncbi:hypothetical protein EV426DRAFT_676135 [Tirmania nivea]|nr:hypothetical protein EV426DRAFT_676135 [Tirmania nivea]